MASLLNSAYRLGVRAAAPAARIMATSTAHRSPFTHIDSSGNAHMVDVSDKPETARTAIARGHIQLSPATFDLVKQDKLKKGNVLTVAQIAGIQAAKQCAQLIPLCHPIALTSVQVQLQLADTQPLGHRVAIESRVRCQGATGVEMEALAAVSAAALTVFDMCKAVDKTMCVGGIRVVEKSGGQSGHWKDGSKVE
ncbi:hypothetical protein IWW51_003276 [Coemansia sp. RSA 2702]|nr:hypothetical protein IWW52_004383 [Coemansia sp. RSA 2704]KAJ2324434.1 hypothetical protein IWW51_003276 [Coemansia sp. RSA 2702]